ncbi:MAG: cation:proton antiporter, partial [Thermotogae bacterium]
MVRIYVLFNLALIVSSMLTFLNKFKKSIPLAAGFVNLVVANVIYWSQLSGEAVLWNSFGVKLILDNISRDFLLMNSIVFLASTIVATKKEKPSVFFFLLALFLPSCNLMFLSCDMFNIYVLLELTTLVVFLLASFGGKTNQVWSALKYMVLGTAGMNLYLLGVGMIFARSRTFELPTLVDIIPAVLVISGLLVKAGVFLFSMWLPDLHSSVESELSALLSGVGIKTAVYAILRFSPSLGKTVDVVVLFGVVSAIAGVVFALNERNYKRILAYHTLSQVGFVLSAP